MSDRPLGAAPGKAGVDVNVSGGPGTGSIIARAARAAPPVSLQGLVAARLVQAVVVALVVGMVGFAMLESLPGDAAFRIAAGRYGYDQVTAAAAGVVRA